MRLINGDTLKELRDKYMRGEISFDNEGDLIDKCPTIDAEPVTRCRNCHNAITIDCVLYCTHWRMNTFDDGYCHEGF